MSERRKFDFLSAVQFPIYLIVVLWIVHIFKIMMGVSLSTFALYPREVDGLIGIFTAPFIHGNISHITSNSVPLFVLSLIICLFYRNIAIQSIFLIYVLTGLAVWGLARGNVAHIGASGVVYGLVSFVFWTGIFRRNLKSIVLALIVTLLYSGYFLGVLPNQRGISWESHLFGGLVGILVAYWLRERLDNDERDDLYDHLEEGEKKYYLPRDTFERTRSERQAEIRPDQ